MNSRRYSGPLVSSLYSLTFFRTQIFISQWTWQQQDFNKSRTYKVLILDGSLDLVTSAPSVAVFRSRLKTHLFNISYPFSLWLYSACAVTLVALDTIIVLAYLLTYTLRRSITFQKMWYFSTISFIVCFRCKKTLCVDSVLVMSLQHCRTLTTECSLKL